MLFYFSEISKRLREGGDTPDDRGPGGERAASDGSDPSLGDEPLSPVSKMPELVK